MKILLLVGLMWSTLFAADFRGEGTVQLSGGDTAIGDAIKRYKSASVTGFLKYKYRLYTMMGEPIDILQAQWTIDSVYFESLEGVEGKNLTYGICEVKENASCVPAEVMQTAHIKKLRLVGNGNGFMNAGYSYIFDAGIMKSPGIRNEYGAMSTSSQGSPSWEQAFFQAFFPVDREGAKAIMKQKKKDLFNWFDINVIEYDLGSIRRYIEKRAKDELDAEEAKKKAKEEKARLEKERLEAEARAREVAALAKEAKDVDAEYDRLMADEKSTNKQRVTEAQNKLRHAELRDAQQAKKRRNVRLAQLERERQDRARREARLERERQARVEIEAEREREAGRERERLARERAEREAKRRRVSSKDVFVDSSTGLMWQDDRAVKTTKRDWSGAKRYCRNLTLAGRSDWYLPDKNQLLGLYGKKSRLKNVSTNFYWSSNVSRTSSAWAVRFDNGVDSNNFKTYSSYVRCVRDGQ